MLLTNGVHFSRFLRGAIMMRASWLLGLSILALALIVGIGASGETKKDKEKFKGQLPTGWKNLKDLSKD